MRAAYAPVMRLSIADEFYLVRFGAKGSRSSRPPRECPCGERLSGAARKVQGTELCERCRRRHYRGEPQLRKEDVGVPATALAAAVRRLRPPSPLDPPLLPPLPGLLHATRHAYAAAATSHEESKEQRHSPDAEDLLLGDQPMEDASLLPPLNDSFLSFVTQELSSTAGATLPRRLPMLLLEQPTINEALRIAMHLEGDTTTMLPVPRRTAMAERYIEQRIGVDQHTAPVLLDEASKLSKVFLLRDFPGALPPAYSTVSAFLHDPLPVESRHYSFNERGKRVHVILHQPVADTLEAQHAFDWWKPLQRRLGARFIDDLSQRRVWTFISRRAGSGLHTDDGASTCTQWQGRKLWVLVNADEAGAHGIEQINTDIMRDDCTGTHGLMAWLHCDSFRWCLLNPGDTIVLPGNYLHAVRCIGDEDSISSGTYYSIQTPTPPSSRPLSPAPTAQSSARAARMETTPLAPLPAVQRALNAASFSYLPLLARAAAVVLHDDGQPTAMAAAKAGMSARQARRWNKRARESDSLEDAPRSGRPRLTDAHDDAAIVRLAQLHPFLSNRKIRNQLALQASVDTIQRRLNDAGLPSCIAAQKRHYTEAERLRRLSFARGYLNWTAEQWEHVIWSDEKTAEGEGRERQQRVHRPAGERFNSLYTHHRTIFAPSCHVFACFCARGPGLIEIYEGKLDGKALRELLKKTVLQTAKTYFDVDHAEKWWFQHDNSPPFDSKVCNTWIHNNGIFKIEFPPSSPDLNPIENIWPVVDKLIDDLHPTTSRAVAEAFKACWQRIPLEIWNDYAQSMPARCQAVIDANGDATSY
jgi:transposase